MPVSFAPLGPSGVRWSSDPSLLLESAGQAQEVSQDATSGVTVSDFSSSFDIDVIVASPSAGVSTTETVQVTYDYSPTGIPEPETMPLAGIGLIAAVFAARWRSNRSRLPERRYAQAFLCR